MNEKTFEELKILRNEIQVLNAKVIDIKLKKERKTKKLMALKESIQKMEEEKKQIEKENEGIICTSKEDFEEKYNQILTEYLENEKTSKNLKKIIKQLDETINIVKASRERQQFLSRIDYSKCAISPF